MGFKLFVDSAGVPYSDYGVYNGLRIGRQRSILAVAERGLWYWNEFLREGEPPVLLSYDWSRWPANFDQYRPDSSEGARDMLIACATWLLSCIQKRGEFSVWSYSYPFSYGTVGGWRSAHAQAAGLQLLVRAAKVSGRADYTAPARALLTAFGVNVCDGGLATRTEGGNLWFEKIADENNAQPKILNGLLFTILGLRDVADLSEYVEARDLADIGAIACTELLPRFDLGDWSAYDIHGRRASSHYHNIHIEQLEKLATETLNPTFAKYRDVFRSYLTAA
jgi:heparosan-N-sulfate-glucuronate 5-epimerase